MPLLQGGRRLQTGNRSRPGASHSHQDGGPNKAELPDYEPPSFPLNPESRRALSQLSTGKDTRKYEEQLNKSIELLSGSVRDLNDKYAERRDDLQRIRQKRGENEKNDRERTAEKALLLLKGDVPQLTDECDHAVRSVVDLKIELEDSSQALKDTERRAVAEADDVNAMQRRRNDQDEDMDINPPDVIGPVRMLQEAREKAAARYASQTLYEKYGVNNDYIGFKRLWHDAVERDGKPLPDASRWFTQNGSRDDPDDDDDDEDLIIAEEHLDIHCPLSMAVMQDPYTSRKCKHTFEKDSVVQFLSTKPGRRARCPQTGCNKEVSIEDFHPDPIMLRRIKRRLAAQRASLADDDDDDDDDGPEKDVDAGGDSEMIKPERKGESRDNIENDEEEEEEDEEDEEEPHGEAKEEYE
ncbi:zinc-finger of the MIZ type in Nse subunit-domain-containing protein [Hypoxylon fuscum]|nr:zinc-finger of the MIZ type in Nse subunit-domain-containing protein [Hypoxylon fuscum]